MTDGWSQPIDFVTSEVLAEAATRFGQPARLQVRALIGRDEMQGLVASQKGGRAHDVTFFIHAPGAAAWCPATPIALIRKPSFPPLAFRAPSGGLRPGESLAAGAAREAWEETGLTVDLERYFLCIDATFALADGSLPDVRWQSHLVTAAARTSDIEPQDRHEIAEARWGTLAELTGPIRPALLAPGRGLLRYRVWLHDRAAEALGVGST
ncbi:MAG TPA: NUDIX hydrolase [Bacillota bacterium]|nr:NUDIX hydrolase [Bacillota bacterium]